MEFELQDELESNVALLRQKVFNNFDLGKGFHPRSMKVYSNSISALEKYDYAIGRFKESIDEQVEWLSLAAYSAALVATWLTEAATNPMERKEQFIENIKTPVIQVACKNIIEVAGKLGAFTDVTARKFSELLSPKDAEERIKILLRRVGELEKNISSIPSRIINAVDSTVVTFDERLKTKESQFDKSVEKLEAVFKDTIDSVELSRAKLSALIGETTALHLTKSYQQAALSEYDAARKFRWATMLAMGLSLGFLAYVANLSFQENFNPTLAAPKIALSFFLLIPTAYMARESGKHRHQFHKLRQTALDLAAVSPYLESVEKKSQDKVKVDIATKIFVPAEAKGDGDGIAINTHELIMKMMDKLDFPSKRN